MNVKEELKIILTLILNDRIAFIPHAETKLELLFDLEKRKKHEILLNIVMEHAVTSLEQMFSSQQVL